LKKKKPLIKDKEKSILRYLDENAGAGTAHEVSIGTGMAYVTVRKYLDRLVKDGVLEIEEQNGKEKNKKNKK